MLQGTSVVSGLGEAVVVAHRRPDRVRPGGGAPRRARARDRVRARHAPVRVPHPPGRAGAGPLRLPGQRAVPARPARVLPLRGGAGGRAHARAPAHDRLGHAVARRGAHGAEEGHRQAAGRHRELRQHGHPLQRQDGHADRRRDLRRPPRERPRRGRRRGHPAGRAQQRLPDRAQEPDGRGHPAPRAPGRRALPAPRRDPLRLPAAPGVGGRRGRGRAPARHQGRARERAARLRGARAGGGLHAAGRAGSSRRRGAVPPALQRGLPRPRGRVPACAAPACLCGRRRARPAPGRLRGVPRPAARGRARDGRGAPRRRRSP